MYYQRTIFKDLVKHLENKQITVLTGMRRTGKTTLLKKLLTEIKSNNKIYIDLERLDNRELFSERNYDNIILAIKQKGIKPDEKMYILLDEIQLLPNLSSVIKYLYDTYQIKFIVTGSSSYYLKNMFTESLAGRKKVFELRTLSFKEFLNFKGIKINKSVFPFTKFSQYEYEQLNPYYTEFIEFGSFPEAALTDSKEDKIDLLNDIINSYIYIDLKSLTDIRNIENVKKLLKLLSSRIGSKLIISKIASLTQISRETIKNYLQFLEDTFFIKRVNVFSTNPDREITKTQKFYFTDNGLAAVLVSNNSGKQFENSLYNQLSNYGVPQYYARKDGKEIDFLLNGFAFEVKESPDIYDLKNLKRISEKIPINNFALIGRYSMENFANYIWGGSIN